MSSAQPAGQKDQGPGSVTTPSPCAPYTEDPRTVLGVVSGEAPTVKAQGLQGREHTEMGALKDRGGAQKKGEALTLEGGSRGGRVGTGVFGPHPTTVHLCPH